MPLLLTEDAVLRCDHKGTVSVSRSQDLLTIAGRAVLIDPDTVNRSIFGCPMEAGGLRACLNTTSVKTGYSELIIIKGQQVCLATLTGKTDGTPPGDNYSVSDPGQGSVTELV